MKHLWLLAALFSLFLAGSASAAEKALVNVDKTGLALQGYDPVAFFTIQAPVRGKPEFSTEYRGARYQFHSAKNKAAFEKEPKKFEPAFGGYCAYGVSKGKLVEVDVEAFQIVNDRLLLQYSPGVRDQFSQDPQGNLKKAEFQWPNLVEKKGK